MKKDLVKNTRKNNKKILIKSRKNKNMSGGRPNVRFPYTYFILGYDVFMKYLNILNPYLTSQTNACNNIAVGQKPEYKYNGEGPFLKDNTEVCILVLRYDDAFNLNNQLDFFNDPTFLNKILGHAKLKYYNNLSLLGIYNVCLHVFNINVDPQGNVTSEQKQTDKGDGSVLFNCIKTSTSFLHFDFNKMWLGIDINNVQFEKLAWLYTSKGFKDPIYSNIFPDGTVIPFNTIQLTSQRGSYINNKDDVFIPFLETIDLYNQIKTPLGQEGIFKFKFNFDKSAILSLRLMPFISFSETKQTLGIEDYNKQRETAGRFLIYNSKQNNNDIINNLSLEVLGENSTIKFNTGEIGTVEIIPGQRVFHTHPFINYKINNTLIGPPSSPDLISFIHLIVKHMQTPMSEIPQFGAVIAIEGIYIYSLSTNGIRHLKNGQILHPDIIKNYEYPFDQRKYDWSTYATDTTIEDDSVNNEITKYLNWFEDVNKKFGNYFKVDFKPWKIIDDTTQFEVHYYNGNRTKIAPTPQNEVVPMEVVNDKMEVVDHERPELIDETLLKKQRINGGKKLTIKKRTIKKRSYKL